ncbi:MAG TPA: TetR/AcrR family transcriptional regulator [Candidatus Agrococcus pullicola]|uniref:TetR/AcrR family transcriptional regulator n=1 Tax=Candidatus Agrococcus pullicola TaxID=2838429 RepID=A0A9D2C8T4_9MICO|nr:TetR/AcrR family transcriptional regulator [Candidatus Agrococcus pullicola]
MPAPQRVTHEEIVSAARAIVERDGVEQLTMRALADALGVKPPSLYKRLRDRRDVIRLVAEDGIAQLTNALNAIAPTPSQAPDRLRSIARAVREFGLEHPGTYALIFDPRISGEIEPAGLRSAVQPVLDVLASEGHDDPLSGARVLTAWLHGFVSMEVAGAFRFGGSTEVAFEDGLGCILRALDV